MLDELWFSDPSTHLFAPVRRVARHSDDSRLLGVYGQRLDAANLKVRFAALARHELGALVGELEHGEFIYFDDASRLRGTYYLESFVIFLRAAIDASASAYSAYFTGLTNVDSIKDLLRDLPAWLPLSGRPVWEAAKTDYDSEDYTWIHMLVGSSRGESLRDLAVHRCALNLDTMTVQAKGRFVISLDRTSLGAVLPWIDAAMARSLHLITSIKDDIQLSEQASCTGAPCG